jgi:orotate phosphoribosyltransferase
VLGFYHVATLGDYRAVVAEQLAALESSGLLKATTRLRVFVAGDGPLPELPEGAEVVRLAEPIERGEVPTLRALRAAAIAEPTALVYYLHTKGVSYPAGDPRRVNVALWRRYMEHFVVRRWKSAVEALGRHDLYGVEWVEPGEEYTRTWGGGKHVCPGKGHFAGNFWWARADYLATLPDRMGTDRFDAEWFFLAEGPRRPRVACPHRARRDLYLHPYPPERYDGSAAERRVEPNTIVTAARLASDAAELAARVPPDVDAVVAISRSGLMPGGLIAAARHLPVYTVSRQAGVLMPGHGIRMEDSGRPTGPPRHVLLVDDTVGNGVEMGPCERLVREAFPGAAVTRAAVYATPAALTAGRVDLYGLAYEGSHYLEWNWPNSHGVRAAFDFDGVLCRDCTPAEDDGGPRYAAFLEAAEPLYLPRRAPIRLIVTARHERYRPQTEAWLDRHGLRCDRLVMRDFEYGPDPHEQVAQFKARLYREAADLTLFAESDPALARRIHKLAGKAVLCPQLGKVLPKVLDAAALKEVLSNKCGHRHKVGGGCNCTALCTKGRPEGEWVEVSQERCVACVNGAGPPA